MSDIQLKSGQFSELKFGVDQSALDNLANEFNTKLDQASNKLQELSNTTEVLENVKNNILETIGENAVELQGVKDNIQARFEETQSNFEAAISASEEKTLENTTSYINQIAGGLQSQIDGEVNSWFFEGKPTSTNKPVTDWKAEAEETNTDINDIYLRHVGDTYTDISAYIDNETTPTAGQSWRWCEGNVDGETIDYHWHEIADSDAVKALREAGKAMATADGKSTIFYNVPEKYQIGDMWILQDSYSITYDDGEKTFIKGTILNANKDSESFVATDWTENVRYTDDTAAQTAIENAELADQKASDAQKTASVAKNQLDEIDNDNIIAITEFATLETQMEQIEAEYIENTAEADKYNVNSDEYTTAYEKAITALKYHCGKVYDEQESKAPRVEYEVNGEKIYGGIEIVFEGDYGYNNIAAYYTIRQSILESISDAADAVVKAYADDVAEAKMREIQADLDDAKADISTAAGIAEAAKNQLIEWSQDSVISPLEIQGIKDEQARIFADYNEINADYNKYAAEMIKVSELYETISLTTFNEYYNTYNGLLGYFIDTVTETNEPVAMVTDDYNFVTAQSGYYGKRTEAYKAIAYAVELAANNFATAEAAREAGAIKTEIDNDLISVNETLSAAAGVAAAAKNQLESWSDDNAITHFEVKGIKDEQARILADHTEIHKNYTDYSMNSEDDAKLLGEFDLIYNAYNNILTKYSQATASTPVKIEPEDNFDGKQKDYYDKRIVMYEAIAAKVKAMADASAAEIADAAAAAKMEEINGDLVDALDDIAEAKQVAQEAKDQLGEWSSDSVISPLEIQGLKDEQARILADYNEINADYDKYKNEIAEAAKLYEIISLTTFNDYYNAYNDQLDYYIKEVAETKSPVKIETGDNGFSATQSNYYEKRTSAYEAIAYAVKIAANNFATSEAAREAEAVKTEIDNDLISVNETLSAAAGVAAAAKNQLDLWSKDGFITHFEIQGLKDEVTRITTDYTEICNNYTDYSMDSDTNKAQLSAFETAYTNYKGQLDNFISTVKVDKPAEIPDNFDDNQAIFYNMRTDMYKYIADKVKAIADASAAEIADAAAAAKMEEINGDLVDALDDISAALGIAEAAQNQLIEWSSDSVISPLEIQGIKDEQARILADYDEINADYGKYEIGTPVDFNNAYSQYNNHLSAFITGVADTKAPVEIPDDPETGFAACQKKFYDERTAAYNAIAAAVEKAANDFAAAEAAREAGAVKTAINSDLERVNETLSSAVGVAQEAKNQLIEWSQDGVISPFEIQGIKDELASITADYDEINADYGKYELGTPVDFNSAHESYSDDLNYIIDNVTSSSSVGIPASFSLNQANYYVSRTSAYSEIADKVQEISQDFAIQESSKSLQRLDDMANDSLITPQEIGSVKREWESIEQEHLVIDQNSHNIWVIYDENDLETNYSQFPEEYWNFIHSYEQLKAYLYSIGLFIDDSILDKLDIGADSIDKFAYEINLYELTNSFTIDSADYYIYSGETTYIDGEKYYVWDKYEDNEFYPYYRILTSSLDFDSDIYNPYHPDYMVYNEQDEIVEGFYSGERDGIICVNIREDRNIEIDPAEFRNYFNNYYNSSISLQNKISQSYTDNKTESIEKDLEGAILDIAENEGRLAAAEQAAEAAQNQLNLWSKDGFITHFEVQGIKDEMTRIIADKDDITTDCNKYDIDISTDYSNAYADYYEVLEDLAEATAEVPVKIPDYFSTRQEAYYDQRTVMFSNITVAIQAFAQKAASDAAAAAVKETKTYISGIESNLQNQIDGVVDSWFMKGAPTLTNSPVSDWKAEAGSDTTKLNNIYQRHVGDTYTNINSAETDTTGGQSWRWCPGNGEGDASNTGYHWHKIADSDATKALLEASKAQYAADSKRRVFTSTPTVPYDEGDLWVDSNKKTLVCITSKDDKSSYAFADWVDTTNADAVKAKADSAKALTDVAAAQSTANAAKSKVEAQEYMKAVLEKGSTDINGGLVLTNVLALRDTDNTTVTAGMSGVKSDNILLWGGGTYEDAVTAKNNTTSYKKQNGTPITTLLKKDGTGKIGVFRIESNKASIYDGDGKERVLITTDSLGDYIEDFFEAADNGIETLELNRTYSSSSSPTPSITQNSLSASSFKYTTHVLADTLYLPTGGASGDYVLRGNLNISGRISLGTIDKSFNPDYYDPKYKVNIEVTLSIINTKVSDDRGLVVKLYNREISIDGLNNNKQSEKFVKFEFNRDLNNLLSVSSSASYNVRLSISITPINCSFNVTTYNGSSNKTTLINSAQNITVNGKIYFTNDKNSQTAVARDGLSIISNPYNYFMVDSTSPKFQKIFINGVPGQTNTIDINSQVEDNQLYMDCYTTNESTDPTYRLMENLYKFISAASKGLEYILNKDAGVDVDVRMRNMSISELESCVDNVKNSLKTVNILCLKDTGDYNMLND